MKIRSNVESYILCELFSTHVSLDGWRVFGKGASYGRVGRME